MASPFYIDKIVPSCYHHRISEYFLLKKLDPCFVYFNIFISFIHCSTSVATELNRMMLCWHSHCTILHAARCRACLQTLLNHTLASREAKQHDAGRFYICAENAVRDWRRVVLIFPRPDVENLATETFEPNSIERHADFVRRCGVGVE